MVPASLGCPAGARACMLLRVMSGSLVRIIPCAQRARIFMLALVYRGATLRTFMAPVALPCLAAWRAISKPTGKEWTDQSTSSLVTLGCLAVALTPSPTRQTDNLPWQTMRTSSGQLAGMSRMTYSAASDMRGGICRTRSRGSTLG